MLRLWGNHEQKCDCGRCVRVGRVGASDEGLSIGKAEIIGFHFICTIKMETNSAANGRTVSKPYS